MTDNEFRYWVFLAYSPQDNCEKRPETPEVSRLCWGNWLRDALKNFSVPADFAGHINARGEIIPERIDPVFQDEHQPADETGLSANIREALEHSRYLIVICSPRSAKSVHVNEVVRHFRQLGRGNRIFPVVVAGEPKAGHGNSPTTSSDDCFVPALRHPVKPDGTLDTTRQDGGHIFADARYGADKREILAKDHQKAEIELEIAKIQLIAGLIGVGFNGLLRREQERRFVGFAEAQSQAQEARNQVHEAQSKFEEAERQVQTLQRQARDAASQLEETRNQVREAQSKVLEIQNLPQDVKSQIQDAQNQALEAQSSAREAQSRVQELQNQVRESQSQLEQARSQVREALQQFEEARNQARAAESKVLETQNQAREAQNQVAEVRNQVRDAQNKILELQTSPPPHVQSQLQEAQNKALEAHGQAHEAQSQIQELRNLARAAQEQLEQARIQTRDAQRQFEEAHYQASAAENKVLEVQKQVRDAQGLIHDFESQARTAQGQLDDARKQVLDAQSKLAESQNLAREAQDKFQEVQSQIQEARSQAREAQKQAEDVKNKARAARRLTRVFAIMAVLALLAVGIVASVALRQRQVGAPDLAKTAAAEVREFDLPTAVTNQEQILQALQKMSGQDRNRLQSADQFAARIPAEQIPETLQTAAAILDDRLRSHFQKQLLIRLASANPESAMTNASGIEGKIVNDDGLSDSSGNFQFAVLTNWMTTDLPGALGWVRRLPDAEPRQRALEKIIPALAADNPTNTLALLNEWNPAPDERIYTLLFQHWATNDPIQAISQRQLIPGQDADDKILSAIMTVWKNQKPQAALNWLTTQPDSETFPAGIWRNMMIADLLDGWAAKDLPAATIACRQLPDGAAKEKAWERVLNRRIAEAPASAAGFVTNLPHGDYRQKAITELCQHWADADAPAALAWAQSLSADGERAAAINTGVANWARKDPQAAVQFANQHLELSGAALGEIAAAWSKNDLTATTNWIAGLPDGEKKNAALAGLSETWALKDPQGMAAYALGLPAGEVQTRFLTAACYQLAVRDLPATVELLQPLSDATLRQNILEQAARACELPRMSQAAKFISTMPAGDDQKAVIKGLLASWTPADPETALNWLCSFPETNTQPEQAQSVIKTWAQSEPEAVANWLTNSPAGTAGEEMIGAFLEGAVAKYPAFAGQWTRSIADSARRQKFQIQVARQWLKTDSSAALKWINSLDLPEDLKQSLTAH